MIDVVVTLIPALLWLAYRATYVLMFPVDELVEELSIDVPDFPTVTIDQISATLAVLRWDSVPDSYDEIQFAVVVNGHLVANVSTFSCKLTKLVPNQKYLVSIRACSPITHFHAYSPTICIQTVSDDDWGLLRCLEMKNINSVEVDYLANRQQVLNVSDQADINPSPPNHIDVYSLTADQISAITEESLLHKCAAALKAAALTIETDMNDHDTATNLTCAQLSLTIAERKTEYDQEHDTKTKSDLSVKALERNKDKLTYRKSKLVTQLSAIKSSLDLSQQKLQEKQEQLEKLKNRQTLLLKNETHERAKIHREMAEIAAQSITVKENMNVLDEKFKNLQAEKRRTAQILVDLRPLVAAFSTLVPPVANQTCAAASSGLNLSLATRSRSNSGATMAGDDMFGKDGKIHSRIFDALDAMFQLVPSWREEVLADADACQATELEWRDAFKSAIERYVAVHQQLEMARLKHDRNYEPVKISEYQASIEYGGATNALPKRLFNSKGMLRNFSPPTSSKKDMPPPSVPLAGPRSFNVYTDVYAGDHSNDNFHKDNETGHATAHLNEPAIFSGRPEATEQIPGYSSSMFMSPDSESQRFPAAAKYGALASHTFGDLGGTGSQSGYLYDDISGGSAQRAAYPYADVSGTNPPTGFAYGDANVSNSSTGFAYSDANISNPQLSHPYDDVNGSVSQAGFSYRDVNGSVTQGGYGMNTPLPQAGYAFDVPNNGTRPQSGFPYDDSAYNLQLPVEPHTSMMGSDYCAPAYSYPTDAGASSILLAPSVTSASMAGQFGQTLSMPDLHEPFGFSRPLLGNPPNSGGSGQSRGHAGGRTFAKLLHSGAGSWMSHKFGLSTTPPAKGPSPLWTGKDEGEDLVRTASLHGHNDPLDFSGHTRSVSLNSHIWRSSEDSVPAHHFDLGAVSDMMGQDEFSPFPSRKSWEP